MRLFIASGIFHPESGGPATYLYHLIPALQARGHEINALTFGDASANGYPYPLTRIPRNNYLLRQFNYQRAAARLWCDHDVAYLHTLGLPLPRSIKPRVAKIVGDVAWERAVNKGWVAATTDIDVFQSDRYAPQVEINKARRADEARRLDHIIVPSEYLKRMVLSWGVDPARVSVIYNAMEGAAPFERVSQAEARMRLNLPDAPTLFTAARLTAWKGIDHTLHAISSLPDIRLIIAGDGPMRADLETLAARLGLANRVMFLDRIAREKLPLYFQAADYKVLYSGYEGLSHVLLEALTAGTPIIASDKGGNPEVVQHNVNGLLVPYIDAAALTATLERAFENGTRERLASQAAVGLERFTFGRMVDQTEAVLQRVVDEARR
jgi:glycosyltransferase involved in cell wall biosynthesis